MCFTPQRRALFRYLNFQKWSENGVFCTFWLRNVLRATTACTFSTSQLPKVVREWCVLYILDLEMCFVPQRRALFRHLNFKKCSEREVSSAFSVANLLRATTACTFSIRSWSALYVLTWKCASRRNFFDIATSKSAPRLRCFVHWLGNVLAHPPL